MKIFDKLSEVVYVKVIEDGYLVTISSNPQEIKFESTTPFTTQRLAIGNFSPAESLLRSILKKTSRGIFQTSPIVIIHQIVKNEGGLSEVEIRVLRELAYGAGAKRVYIWQGDHLTKEDICNEIYKNT